MALVNSRNDQAVISLQRARIDCNQVPIQWISSDGIVFAFQVHHHLKAWNIVQ